MDEANEIEALCDVAFRALDEGPIVESPPEWMPRVARAVRDAVLAGLAARGGTQGPHGLNAMLNVVSEAGLPDTARMLRDEFSAQGATIAALQQRVTEVETLSWDLVREGVRRLENRGRALETYAKAWEGAERERLAAEARAEQAERERDEAVSDMEDVTQNFDGLNTREVLDELRQWQPRAIAAESALATLRQAVGPVVDFLRRSLEVRGTPQGPMVTAGQARALLSAYVATPAPEHPDTATLRDPHEGLRERFARAAVATLENPTGNAGVRYVDCCASAVDELGRRLLGDSGPSGGGEWCQKCMGTGSHIIVETINGKPEERTVTCPLGCVKPDPTAPGLAACVTVEAEPETLRTHVERAKAQRSPEPTEAEDWALLEAAARGEHFQWVLHCRNGPTSVNDAEEEVVAALARLKQARQRAAEEMRERCAREGYNAALASKAEFRLSVAAHVESAIRAMPLKPE